MGDIYWGLHAPIANRLIERFSIKTAIETGTYFAGGAIQLAAFCSNVFTIEHDPILHEFCKTYFSNLKNIKFLLGDSSAMLSNILPTIDTPILFVLDAHWFGISPRKEFLSGVQCPIMNELKAIKSYCNTIDQSAIIIDDADMFLGALQPPFECNEFPPISELIDMVNGIFKNNTLDILDDIIVSGPKGTSEILAEYRQWKKRVGTPNG